MWNNQKLFYESISKMQCNAFIFKYYMVEHFIILNNVNMINRIPI